MSFSEHALTLCLVFLVQGSAHAQDKLLESIRTAALETQKQCQMLLHHDAEDYVDCVDARRQTERTPSARRLGIEYFGWVGALNSARMSFPGAHEAADRYLRLFRRTQRHLKISDERLCTSVPGDCIQRIARMRQMEASSPVSATPAARSAPSRH